MFAVLFEVLPRADGWDRYLDIAGALKPHLKVLDGFLDNERFSRNGGDGSLISVSLWRDEKSLVRWRVHAAHHNGQTNGREQVFEDYRLRVGEIVIAQHNGAKKMGEGQRFDTTDEDSVKFILIVRGAKCAQLEEIKRKSGRPFASFTGVVDDTREAAMFEFETEDLGLRCFEDLACERSIDKYLIRIVRSYGMFNRNEAPQYYRPLR